MDSVPKLTPQQRGELFDRTALKTGIDAVVVEKDFWVCWTLKQMFGLSDIGAHLIFKGGTCLSKCFRVIERFSEDIDVSIDRGWLGFGGANDPEAAGSNQEQRRRIAALKVACQRKIGDELLPALRGVIAPRIREGEMWALVSDADDPDQQTLLFRYPSALPATAPGYIRQAVKIEMGARADHWPCATKPVTPYVAEQFPQGFREPSCDVRVLGVERTFWEKATILHAEHYRPGDKAMPDRLSRHYADFYQLIQKGVAEQADKDLALLARVAKHKRLFFRSSWANYEVAKPGTLRILPPPHRLTGLREDYRKMQDMFFRAPPSFDVLLEKLGNWETDFNKRK